MANNLETTFLGHIKPLVVISHRHRVFSLHDSPLWPLRACYNRALIRHRAQSRETLQRARTVRHRVTHSNIKKMRAIIVIIVNLLPAFLTANYNFSIRIGELRNSQKQKVNVLRFFDIWFLKKCFIVKCLILLLLIMLIYHRCLPFLTRKNWMFLCLDPSLNSEPIVQSKFNECRVSCDNFAICDDRVIPMRRLRGLKQIQNTDLHVM